MLKHRWLGILKALGAVLLLMWALHQVGPDTRRVLSGREISWAWVGVGIGFGFLSVLGWATRWFLLLRGLGIDLPFREVFRLTMIADFFNLYFLGPVGADGARFAFVAKQTDCSRASLAASLLLDHVMGLQALVVAFLCFTCPHWEWLVGRSEWIALGAPASALLVLSIGVASGGFFWQLGRRCMDVILSMLPKLPGTRSARAVLVQIEKSPSSLWKACAIAGLSLVCAYATFWASANALGMHVPGNHLFATLPVVDAFATLPVTMSGVGIREHFFLAVFGGDGGDESGVLAVATSLLGFLMLGVWGAIGGVVMCCTKKVEGPLADPLVSRTASESHGS